VRELIATGQLELSKNGRDMALDGLGRDGQLLGDVLVGVTTGDQSQHLAFARGQLVEVRIGDDNGLITLCGAKGVETKPAKRAEKTTSPAAIR